MENIFFFDFLSHADMHLPFNEGLLGVLQSAFPEDRIVFAASLGHLNNLMPYLGGIVFEPIDPLGVARTKKQHHYFAGRRAAEEC